MKHNITPLKVIPANSALRLKAVLDFDDENGVKRTAGDEWLFEGPGTYIPRKEVSVEDTRFAINICNRCPHRSECAEWGIAKEYFVIWGGLTLRQRQVIRSQRGIRLNQEKDIA